jgi:small nuclear ribonucleoprotein (snRNP)-like protein
MKKMSEPRISPTVFHFLERNIGKRVIVIIDRDFGYEGKVEAVSHQPPGIWLSDSEAIILRATLANPIPRIVTKEKKSELFIHLNSVLRVEVLPGK